MKTSLEIILSALFRSLRSAFSVLGVGFTLLEMLKTLNVLTDTPGFLNLTTVLAVFVLLTVLFLLSYLWSLQFTRHVVSESNRTVSLKAGNLLRQRRGSSLVVIDDQLSYQKAVVGSDSIQGQLLERYGEDWMRELVEEFRRKKPLPAGQTLYPVGTVFTGETPKGQSLVFLVLPHRRDNAVPESSLQAVTEALDRLFAADAPFRCQNGTLYMPLIGTGRTGLTVSKQCMAEKIAFQFIHRKQESSPIRHLVITFRFHSLRQIHTLELGQRLKEMAQQCSRCLGL